HRLRAVQRLVPAERLFAGDRQPDAGASRLVWLTPATSAANTPATVIAYAPMRYVLLDRITALEPPERARGVKCVTLADDVFADHFPGHPVMPGALTLESLAQLGGVLCEATMRLRGRNDLHALLVAVERA